MKLDISEKDILSMSDLRRIDGSKDPSLWVLNTSDRQGTRPHGDILIEIPMPGGRNTVVTIPKTWIPIDLSTYARRDVILDSNDFAKAVRSMTLTLVSSEWAESVERRPDVRDERNFLALRSTGGLSQAKNNPAGAPNQPFRPDETDDIVNGVSPRILSIMEAEDSTMSPAAKLLSLKNLQPEIDNRSLRYILSKCGPDHEAISKWVNEVTKTLNSTNNGR